MANHKLMSHGFMAGAVFATGLILLLDVLANSQVAVAHSSDDLTAMNGEAPIFARDSESVVLPIESELWIGSPREASAERSVAQTTEMNGGIAGALPVVLNTYYTGPQIVVSGNPAGASNKGKVIYLTFDDGPSRTWTPEVLALLAHYHAHATFFVVGQNGKAAPDLLKAIAAGGNLLGNHTYDHPWLGHLSRDQVLNELRRTQKALGTRSAPCMRPPFGSTNRFTRSEAAQLGLKLVMWDIDPRDWSRPGASRISSFILGQAYPGAIVLLHDGGERRSQTVAALDSVLLGLSQRGYHFATLPACR